MNLKAIGSRIKTAREKKGLTQEEELVAEITAAALMNHTGLETNGTFRNTAAYIQSWLSALRNDKRLIVTATGAATKAFDYINVGAV